MRIKDKLFKPFISSSEIQQRVAALSEQVTEAYSGLDPLFIGVLNGAFVFAADLFRNIKTPAEITFVKLASYSGLGSTGNVVTASGLDRDIAGRHVIVVEDIIDTGKTLHTFLPTLLTQSPASVKIASFLWKPEAAQCDIKPDYYCFSIPNAFVVGYGLDYDGYGRNLPELYVLADQ